MKTFNKILSMAVMATLAVGCNDLDTEPLGSTVTSEQKSEVIAANPEMAEASTQAIPTMLKQFGNVLGTSQHCDFGYPAIMLGLDSRSADMMSFNIGYNWFAESLCYSDNNKTSRMTRMIWGTMYNQIYSCNAVAGTIDHETTDPQLQYYLAQALAARANCYFVLAQLYQFTYAGHESSPCVPILTDENQDEAAANGAPRASVQEVYNQIMSDINKAVELFAATGHKNPANRDAKGMYCESSARGLRARINLVMNNWNEAASDAQWVISNSSATPYSKAEVSVPTFWDAADHSWLLGVIINEGDRVVTTGICNWPSMACTFNAGGYASVGASRYGNKALVDGISVTDVRKGWWLSGSKTSPNITSSQLEYILSTYDQAEYINVKFANYNNDPNGASASDIPMMRIEEMYLILAEAQAMGGSAAQGAQTLTDFVKTYRDPDYVCTGGSSADVQNEVWRQRRIELWGEGMAYFDMMRLKKPCDRRGGGFEAATIFNIPAESQIFLYLIPQTEEEGNKALGENNPLADIPTPVTD